jgi:hypothetical protein
MGHVNFNVRESGLNVITGTKVRLGVIELGARWRTCMGHVIMTLNE